MPATDFHLTSSGVLSGLQRFERSDGAAAGGFDDGADIGIEFCAPFVRKPLVIFRNTAQGRNARSEPFLVAAGGLHVRPNRHRHPRPWLTCSVGSMITRLPGAMSARRVPGKQGQITVNARGANHLSDVALILQRRIVVGTSARTPPIKTRSSRKASAIKSNVSRWRSSKYMRCTSSRPAPYTIRPILPPDRRHAAHAARHRGIDMSGRRPLIKGYFAALRLIVGAVMSSAC